MRIADELEPVLSTDPPVFEPSLDSRMRPSSTPMEVNVTVVPVPPPLTVIFTAGDVPCAPPLSVATAVSE